MLKVQIWNEPHRAALCIRLYEVNEHQRITKVYLPVNFELQAYPDGVPLGEMLEPTFMFPSYEGNEFLQELSSALVASGFRDKTISKDGEIKRMENHLEDLRSIVYNKVLGIKAE